MKTYTHQSQQRVDAFLIPETVSESFVTCLAGQGIVRATLTAQGKKHMTPIDRAGFIRIAQYLNQHATTVELLFVLNGLAIAGPNQLTKAEYIAIRNRLLELADNKAQTDVEHELVREAILHALSESRIDHYGASRGVGQSLTGACVIAGW
ncbi:hypothetical protein KC906_01595 [Candidatus Kaiserbacteria bacterium]|nr:hypothetical protein [Candidatus Kaiserbacteria bacterium]